MIDARPLRGRAFQPSDETAGAEPVLGLSYGAWLRFFQGAPDVIGRSVTMDSVLDRARRSTTPSSA